MASTSLSFECCHYCVPPKRHPGCHDICGDYAKVKSAREQKKEAEKARRGVADYTYRNMRKAMDASAKARKENRGIRRVGYR